MAITIFKAVKTQKYLEVILTVNSVSDNHGLTKIHVVWAYPLVYIINSGIVFVVYIYLVIERAPTCIWQVGNMVTRR